MLGVATLAPSIAVATVVSGCAGYSDATEANGFFTVSGSAVSNANGCFVMMYDDISGDDRNTCFHACNAGGLGCLDLTLSAPTDCSDAVDWYLASSARRADIPASLGPAAHEIYDSCGVENAFNTGWGRINEDMAGSCHMKRTGGGAELVASCKCGDTTAPSVSSVVGSQASPSSVTVTGTVDEASTVYCNIGHPLGLTHGPHSVMGAGWSDSVSSPGSFTVTITGVSGEGTKTVACVAQDAAGNRGAEVSSGPDFPFGTWAHVLRAQLCRPHVWVCHAPTDTTGPTLSGVSGTHSGSIVDISGSTDEAATMYCIVDNTGASVAASTIKSTGQPTAASSAGSFTVSVSVADVTGKSVFCVGEDGVGNLGSIATDPFGTPPSDISLSATTVAENAAQGTEVGTLTTTDVDAGDTFTYSITAQDVSGAFQINGDKVEVGTGVLDFETTPTVSVTVRSTDSGALTFDKAFTVTVTNVNEAPSGMSLSATTVAENAAQGTEVGTLTTTDADAGDTSTYSITAQDVSGAFQINGDKVEVGTGVLDFEATPTVSVTVRSTDSGGLTFDKVFTVTVTNVNEAPTGIVFTATTVDSQAKVGALVGSLSTVDEDTDDAFAYTIVTAPTNVFYVAGNEVLVGTAFDDLSPGEVVTMNITTTDGGGLALTRSVSTVVIRSRNSILAALGIVTGVMAVAAAFAAAFYVKSTSTAATTASSNVV